MDKQQNQTMDKQQNQTKKAHATNTLQSNIVPLPPTQSMTTWVHGSLGS